MNDPKRPSNPDLDELVDWLRATFARLQNAPNNAPKPGDVVRVRLEHNTRDIPVAIEVYDFALGMASVDDLADEIYERAGREASVLGGASYFVIVDGVASRWTISFDGPAMRGVGMQVRPPGGPTPYGMTPPRPGFGPGFFPSDNPVVGVMASITQAMSDKDTMIRDLVNTMVKDKDDTLRHFVRSNTVLQESFVQNLQAQVRNAHMVEELMQKKHERELEVEKQRKNEERKDKALDVFIPMGMSVAARFFGTGGVPQGIAPVIQLAAQAFKGMNSEQFSKIMQSGLFTPDQIMALVEVLKVVHQLDAEMAATAGPSGASGASNGTNGAVHAEGNGAVK